MQVNNSSNIVSIDSNKKDENIEKVAKEFETMFMKKILENGLKDVNLTQGAGSDIIKGMYIDALSSSTSGLGISDMLYQHLSQKENK